MLVFYPKSRQEWRNWLETNHQTETEVWLQTFKKATGKPSLPYDDLVEECLCFGWIDGVVSKYEDDSCIQRITPRRKKTFLSELNRQRVWKLQKLGLMTPFGIAPIENQIGSPDDAWEIPTWILEKLQENPKVWENFQSFPPNYQRLKIGWITEPAISRGEEKIKRLNYLLKMTEQGKTYGTIVNLNP
jgi:uncharacterized protein YdeI (YjbR/CyaY-like superfamily)